MLSKQQNYLDFTKDIKNIVAVTECLESFKTNLDKLELNIKNQELLVPIIGGFSSGKSSLINSFLETNVLCVNITPETAIATELWYSANEKVEAINDDGSTEKFVVSELGNIQNKAQNYNHIKLYLNNEKLKNIEPIILVDMPRFNAPVATHNKAIQKYMPSGVYFIALLSGADEKALQKTYLNELNGIYQRDKEFTFCISKTNLISQSDSNEIANCVKDQLYGSFGYEKNIELLGLNSGEVLEKILKEIDSEALFERIFKSSLEFLGTELEGTINTSISALRYNEQDAKDAMAELKNNTIDIENQKQEALRNASSKYSDNNIEGILSVARRALENNVSMFAQSALRGGDIEKDISNIINSVLPPEIQKRLSGISKSVIDNFSINIRGVAFDTKNMQTWADGLKDLVESACFVVDTTLNNRGGRKGEKSLVLNSAVSMVGGHLAAQALSKLGFVINPLIGTILSAIFSILPGIFSKFAESKKEEVVKNKIKDEVIPSIISQIRPELSAFINEQVSQIINNISLAFEEKISAEQANIEAITAQKASELGDIEARIANLETQKNELKAISKKYI